jgi:ATP-binding cassette subfamily C (CFTR/MRP) protein 4
MQEQKQIEAAKGAKVSHSEPAQKINPELIENNPRFKSDVDKASILSRLFFAYGWKLGFKGFMNRGKRDYLVEEDLVTIPWSERPDVLSDRFAYYMQERKKRKPNSKLNLSLAILKSIKGPLAYITIVETIFVFVRIFSTWVLKKLVEAFLSEDSDSSEAYKWSGVLTACLVVGFFTEHHWNFPATYYPVLVQNALIDTIFGKVTRISTHALTQLSTGRIINLASNGLNFLDNFGMFFPSILVGIFAMIAGAAVIWQSFGAYTLIGVGYIAAWYPLQALSIFGTTKQRAEQDEITNERVKTTSETVEGIRLLKMYTWEMKFKAKIEDLRKKEIDFLKGATIGGAIGRACAFSVQDCGSFLMFLAYYYTDHTLETGAVFSAYFVLGYLRIFGSYFISAALLFIEEAGNVFGAIEKVLEAAEVGDVKFEQPKDSQNSVEYDNFTAYWEVNDPNSTAPKRELQPTLSNVNLNIKKGTVNALVGVVGSGKTSFLMSFTGEMPKTSGQLRYKGNIAYVEQEPTIFAGTFRENVLFGKPYDEEKYNQAVKACNLVNDLKLFAKGDSAEIVGGGMNLSGGQKARLAFARAVYADADIYLLDDPLSAVDPKVARSLYNNAIEGALKGKTIILVTHQVDFVKNCENIIVIEKGKVLGSGTLEELQQKGVHPENIFGDHKETSELDNSKAISLDEPELKGGPTSTKGVHAVTVQHHNKPENKYKQTATTQPDHHIIETSPSSITDLNNEKEDRQIISGEKFTGRATLATYIDLFKEMGGLSNFILIIVIITLSQFTIVAFGRILGAWIAGTFPAWQTSAILGGLVGFDIFIFNTIFLVLGLSTLRASKNYHEKMLNKVVNAKALFFDTNPVGQIINRFSNDIGVMDRFIPLGLTDVFNIVGFLFAILITAGIINPILLAPLLVALIVALCFIILSYFSVEQTKMYELKTKGPVFGLLSETLNGLVIMRMYKQEESFKKRFRADLHKSAKGNYAFVLASRVGGFFADMAYTIAVIGCIFILTARSSGELSSAYLAAFSLSLLLGITGLFQYLLRQFSSLNISMSSVARIQEFCNIPSEPAQHLPADKEKTQKGWPDQGKIDVNKVYMKYRPDMDFVLKDLNLEVQAGEKIGCVGRTGAGKSTIVQMLYRMREIDRKEKGSAESYVHFDDVNTQSVGLNLLRGNISMIPQTPYIFSETIRTNIDPLGQHTDEEIWRVLEDVRLKEHIEKQSNGLNTKINGGSSIFSVGQKQLVCLARVVLKPAPVLIMDEATANMDHETDNFLQEKIDQRFEKSTRFTIAHRLTTIANYDKVLVLSKGRKVEYDEPYKLLVNSIGDEELTNKGGHFSIMVQNTGPISSKQIFEIARNAYFDKHPQDGQQHHHHHHHAHAHQNHH